MNIKMIILLADFVNTQDKAALLLQVEEFFRTKKRLLQ